MSARPLDSSPPTVTPPLAGADDPPDKVPRTNAATAAYAASVRGVTAQAVAFYFRAPVKAFFRTRVDYLAYIRALILEEQRQASAQAASADPSGARGSYTSRFLGQLRASLRTTTPGVLVGAIRRFGWRIVPDQVLPPLTANVAVGAVLYTSYLNVLGRLHEQSSRNSSRVYPPPTPAATMTAGFAAGALQSVVAAPLDAIQARYGVQEVMSASGGARSTQSMWAFSWAKLREIGLRGIFAGWGMSFVKDGLGNALFFGTFEYVKAQGYYRFVDWYYGSLDQEALRHAALNQRPDDSYGFPPPDSVSSRAIVRPHYALEPLFLLTAGVAASVVQQIVSHPLTHAQTEHWAHLEMLDAQARRLRACPEKYAVATARQWRMVRAYMHAYRETWAQCAEGAAAGRVSVLRWLYRGFWWSTLRQVPSTSAGLIIFELVRRRYGFKAEEVRIRKDDYDIVLD